MPPLDDGVSAARSSGVLVSIVVPGTGAEWHARLANARQQTWSRCEIVPVETLPDGSDFVAAIHVGFKAAKGEYLSVLPSGTRYAPEKTERQVAFLERFELLGMVLYCGHNRIGHVGAPRAMCVPTPDPSSVYTALYGGMPVAFGSLIFPRRLAVEAEILSGLHAEEPALLDLMLRLARDHPLVGMAEVLLDAPRPQLKIGAAAEWRRVYAHHLPGYIERVEGRGAGNAIGRAIADRLASGVPLAALDLYRASEAPGCAKGTLRGLASRLPVPIKRTALFSRVARVTSNAAGPQLDFDRIYAVNGFGGTESVSGTGSSLFQTRIVRRRLPGLLKEIGASRILDIPSGDFHWMQHVDLSGIEYIGADVVADLAAANRQRYARPGRTFEQVDLVRGPLPRADLVLCRDCLVHLTLAEGVAALDTVFASPARWLLTTTFPTCTQNRELDATGWRTLNLELAPFNLPPPLYMLDEKCTEAGGAVDVKALGLWDLGDLRRRLCYPRSV